MNTQHPHRLPRFLTGAAALLVPPLFSASAFGAFSQDLRMEPQPFRQSQLLEGREFDYNEESFLHRASFMPEVPIANEVLPRDRLLGTGGSTRSDELFFDVAVQTTYDFTNTLDFQYRFRRTEDFDGRYDRNLIGIGIKSQHQPLQFRLMADVEGDKSRTDLQPEISWEHPDGHQLRAALVLTDALFNDKQSDDEFLRTPRTWFIAGRWRATDNHSFRAYANITPETRLQVNASSRIFDDRNGRLGAGWDWDLTNGDRWQWIAETEGTDRHERAVNGNDRKSMTRRFWRSRFEYVAPSASLDYRLGGQAMFLRESGDFIGDNVELTDRKEWMGFAGIGLPLNPNWQFSPTVFATVVEGESVEFDDEPGEKENLNGVYGKISLAFRWQAPAADGASITLNPNFRLHEAAFGGGNLQIHIPL